MKIEDFKSGIYQEQFQYKSFLPELINQEWTWDDPRMNVLLEKATKALAELNAYTLIVPDVDLFIHMHILKEANTSSRIEGTQTEMDDVILDETEVLPEKKDDWSEVQNYVKAINTAIKELESLPLSMRLLNKTHAILLDGVRGEHKTPGEQRKSQNWVGGTSLTDAVYIPPHQDEIGNLLSDLEKFWHNDAIHVPHLIRVAISHYQFETIHPFLDGNGRIGRLLITLYLVSHGLLSKPSLYLSAHLEKYRTSYYDALSRVRESHDLGQWCRFFLQAVIETAESGISTFQNIMELRNDLDQRIVTLGRRAENARRLVMYLYQRPFTTVNSTMELLDIKYVPASKLIAALVDLGILNEMTGYKRNRIFMFDQYLDVFRNESIK